MVHTGEDTLEFPTLNERSGFMGLRPFILGLEFN